MYAPTLPIAVFLLSPPAALAQDSPTPWESGSWDFSSWDSGSWDPGSRDSAEETGSSGEEAGETGTDTSAAADADAGLGKRRDYLMEVNFRGRYLSIPDSILDIWFFDSDDGEGLYPRPQAMAYAAGLEYVIKKDSANGIFYFEYAGSLMDEGYWDDREREGSEDHGDGDYIVPDNFGLLVLGADYAYEIHADTWLSFLIGSGLGVAVRTGNLQVWHPGWDADGDPSCTSGDPSLLTDPENAPAYERYEAGCGDDGSLEEVPTVLPMVDINVGVRFNFSDRANLRIEGGFHDMLYAGVATGVVF